MPPKGSGKRKGGKKAPSEWVSAERARELLVALEAAPPTLGERPTHKALSTHQLLRLIGWHTAQRCGAGVTGRPCSASCDNVRCVCSAAPPKEGSFRRKGLWQKQVVASAVKSRLGSSSNPAELRKEDVCLPTGLTNLGQTCYVNSALQCLFANTAFRAGLFAVPPPWSQRKVVSHLRRLMAELQAGPLAVASPAPFAHCLQLDNRVQQDGSEFLKLLLTVLETELKGSPQAALVQGLYRGQYSFITTCQVCHQQSVSSSSTTPFYELELGVMGCTGLTDSLSKLLAEETLAGENQYYCEKCNKKVDAVRQMKLRTLPQYLCFSLMRFVFDMKTFSKVKVHDKFKFPLQLDLSGFVDKATLVDDAPAAYQLSTVLIHRGTTASAGHYVARVMNESDGVWWEFNDEEVKRLGDLPISGAPSEPTSSKARDKKGTTSQKSSTETYEANDERDDPTEVSSKDAYMLVYRRAPSVEPSHSSGIVHRSGATVPQLDAELAKYINSALREQEQYETTYNGVVDEISTEVERRRSIVRSVFGAIAASGEEQAVEAEELRFCDVQELGAWADASGFETAGVSGDSDGEMLPRDAVEQDARSGPAAAVPTISNAALLCSEHEKLRLGRNPARLRALPLSAYRVLKEVATVEPELSLADVCWECLRSDLEGISLAEEDADRRSALLQDASAVLDGTYERAAGGDPFYLVSKQWLRSWVGRSGRSLGSTNPTERLACSHGLLFPEAAAGRPPRVAIPKELWQYICDAWRSTGGRVVAAGEEVKATAMAVDGGDEVLIVEGGEGADNHESGTLLVEYPEKEAHRHECAACLIDSLSSGQQDEEDREARRRERETVSMLASGVSSLQLGPGVECRLIPAEWLRAWQKYVAPTKAKKSDGIAPRPPPLREAFAPLLCDCAEHAHSPWLAIPPPALQRGRGRWGVEVDEYGIDRNLFAIVSPDEWCALTALYSSPSFAGVSACAVGDGESALHLTTDPGVCIATVTDRESALRAAALTYSAAELGVELVVDDEAAQVASLSAPSINEMLAKAECLGRRPKRSRRQGTATLIVDSSNTLAHLKAKLWEALQVHPRNARLHYRGQLLEGDQRSLAEANVFEGDTVYVVDTKEFDDNDYLAMVPDSAMLDPSGTEGGRAVVEQGFKNTVLVGSGSPAQCGNCERQQ